MMEFADFSFKYSLPGDPSHSPPPTFFSTLPYRTSKFKDETLKGVCRASKDLINVLGDDAQDFISVGGTTERGHWACWVMPECPAEKAETLGDSVEAGLYWDDVTDIQDPETHDDCIQELQLAIISKHFLGKSAPMEHPINKFYYPRHKQMVKMNGRLSLKTLSMLRNAFSAQPVTTNDMTFEAYKTHRLVGFGASLFIEAMCFVQKIHVSQKERESVWHFLKKGCLSSALLNDLYSFPKEFDAHTKAGNLDTMQNATSILMRGYGYTENEAYSILKQEILKEEKEMMDQYKTWEALVTPKSDQLRKFVVLSILVLGGTNYWMSHSPRYHKTDLTTTEEDRAQIIGKSSHGIWKLKNYPPPQTPAPAESVIQKPQQGEVTVLNKQIVNGLADGLENGLSLNSVPDFLRPFKKAPSEKICMEPYEYIQSLPGKNTLVKFIDALQIWLRLPIHSLDIVKGISVMLFNSTLMLDDIEDGSQLRRGLPAAHVLYGQSQTINSANYLFVKALEQCQELKNEKFREAFVNELGTLSIGQSFDLYWRYHAQCPTIDEYIVMIDSKTGGFFRFALRLMEAEASAPTSTSLLRLITLLGRYYQIRDDYLNLVSEEYTTKKGFCDDLDEGKFSLPLIHFLQHSPTSDRVRGLLFHRPEGHNLTFETKSWILSEMKEAGSVDYVADILTEIHDEMLKTLDNIEAELGSNKKLKIMIIALKV